MVSRSVAAVLAATGAGFLLSGCERPATPADTVPPEVTVIVSGARGGNIFRSKDGVLDPGQDCVEVAGVPAQLIMIAGDAGGVRRAGIRAFTATVVPGSVEVTPAAPEATFAIRSESGSGILEIALTPPAPGSIRTGATAILEVTGGLPIAVVAWADDYAGHHTELPQFDLRGPESAVICRGSN